MSFKTISFLLMGAAAFSLGACNTINRPHFFPAGYAYHNQAYKSAPPGESPRFTAAQRQTMTPAQADQFRLGIFGLVQSLTDRAGLPPKPVYVVQADPMTPFYARLDNDLRESLRHLGYTLSDTPKDAYALTYSAEGIKDDRVPVIPSTVSETAGTKNAFPSDHSVEDSVKADQKGTANVRLALQVFDKVGEDAALLTEESNKIFIEGAEMLTLPFASFPGTLIPEPTGPGVNFRD